jgi:hypothetical protein
MRQRQKPTGAQYRSLMMPGKFADSFSDSSSNRATALSAHNLNMLVGNTP